MSDRGKDQMEEQQTDVYGEIPTNNPTIQSVTVKYDPQDSTREKVVTFFSGLIYWEPNLKFGVEEDKFRYAAALRHPRPVIPQLKEGVLHAMFKEGVADFDCVKDYISVKHYPDLDNVGNAANIGFSFEVWIRIRHLPQLDTSAVIFCKREQSRSHYYCLTINHSGALSFIIQSSSRFEINTEDETIGCDLFYHVAVTGTVGSTVYVIVNGETLVSKELTSSIATLPGHSTGDLILGKDCTGGSLKHFCGQMTAFYIYDKLRTEGEINAGRFKRSSGRGGTVCSYDLKGVGMKHTISYYITNKYIDQNEVPENPRVLPGFYDSSPVPLRVLTNGRKIVVIHQNTVANLDARRYRLDVVSNRASLVEEDSWSIDVGGTAINKGFFSAVYCTTSNTWVIFVLDSESNGKIHWKMYDENFVAKTQSGCMGSLTLKNSALERLDFDTHPALTMNGNHVILSAGSKTSNSVFILDMLLNNGCPEIADTNEAILPSVGPMSNNWGADYYVYLGDVDTEDSVPTDIAKKTSGSGMLSYLRRKHVTISHPMTYEIEEVEINPNTNRPAGAINANTASNDWSWFLFRISSPNGGTILQSGQRVLLQAPDNDVANNHGWVQLKVENGELKADNTNLVWNFLIFKVNISSDDTFEVVPGEIFIDSDVVFLPSSSSLYRSTLKSEFFPTLTEAQIRAAMTEFPDIFRPWKLLAPPRDASDRPLPAISDPSGLHHPGTVQEGNRLSLISRSQNLEIPRIQSGIWGGILNFARTVSAPAFSMAPSDSRNVHLIFRGNGVPSHIYTDSTKEEIPSDLDKDVYQEGSYAQNHMSSGLFYSVDYRIAQDGSSSAHIGHLNHVQNLKALEYPTPPQGFVWLVAPPLKIMGMTGEVAQFYEQSTFSVNLNQNGKMLAFYEVSKAAVGTGTFNEGIFQPLLTIPINIDKLNEIAIDLKEQIWERIEQHVPEYDADDGEFQCQDQDDKETWCVLGDFYVARAFSKTDTWKEKVDLKSVSTQMGEAMSEEWMQNYIRDYYDNYVERYFRDEYKKYAAYGGFAKIMADNLMNPPLLRELTKMTETERNEIFKSQFRILRMLDPELSTEVMTSFASYLLAYTALLKPESIITDLEAKGTKDMALENALITLLKIASKNSGSSVEDPAINFMKAIASGLTSTQIGVVLEWLANIKTKTLTEAADVWTKFKNIFANNDAELKIELELWRLNGVTSTTEVSDARIPGEPEQAEQDRLEKLMDDYVNPFLEEYEQNVHAPYRDKLKKIDRNVFRRWLRTRKFHTAINHFFAAAGTGCAIYGIYSTIQQPGWQSDATSVLSVVATGVGALGGAWTVVEGVGKLGRLIKDHINHRPLPVKTSIRAGRVGRLNSVENAFEHFPSTLMAKLDVQIGNPTIRLAQRATAISSLTGELSTVFGSLSILSDLMFFGVNLVNFLKDVFDDSGEVTDWQKGMDFVNTGISLAGAATGYMIMTGASAGGPAAVFVLAIGFLALIADVIHSAVEQKRKEREQKCQFCTASRDLLVKYSVLKDESTNTCPNLVDDCSKKHEMAYRDYSRLFIPALAQFGPIKVHPGHRRKPKRYQTSTYRNISFPYI